MGSRHRCNELDHVRPWRPSPSSGRSSGGLSDDCQTIVRRLSKDCQRDREKGVTSRYLRDIKVGKWCAELRSLTEQLVYLRLATIVLYIIVPSCISCLLLVARCYLVLSCPDTIASLEHPSITQLDSWWAGIVTLNIGLFSPLTIYYSQQINRLLIES